jgi:hypothetical protein
MKYEYLNNGEALPAGHPHAGEIGVVIDFEDGRPATQRVYASDKDALIAKAFAMYGNSQVRLAEVKATRQAPTAAAPTTPAATPPNAVAEAERNMQLTSDLNDPAKAGKAIVEFIKKETGKDPVADAEFDRRRAATEQFIANNPDFVPGPGGRLIRDRCLAWYGDVTTEGLQQAYDSLLREGLIQSQQEASPATNGQEPSAPTQTPRGTGVPPSRLGGGGGRPPAAPKLTYEEVLRISETPEYERRLREEPGFQQKVNEACKEFEGRQTRRAG